MIRLPTDLAVAAIENAYAAALRDRWRLCSLHLEVVEGSPSDGPVRVTAFGYAVPDARAGAQLPEKRDIYYPGCRIFNLIDRVSLGFGSIDEFANPEEPPTLHFPDLVNYTCWVPHVSSPVLWDADLAGLTAAALSACEFTQGSRKVLHCPVKTTWYDLATMKRAGNTLIKPGYFNDDAPGFEAKRAAMASMFLRTLFVRDSSFDGTTATVPKPYSELVGALARGDATGAECRAAAAIVSAPPRSAGTRLMFVDEAARAAVLADANAYLRQRLDAQPMVPLARLLEAAAAGVAVNRDLNQCRSALEDHPRRELIPDDAEEFIL